MASGNWYRWSKKNTTSDYMQLQISRLVEAGVIEESVHKAGNWNWLVNDEVKSSIGYESNTKSINSPYLRLNYTNKATNKDYNYKVNLTTTSPNFGGKRWWFECPNCGRRVAVLYSDKVYVCRKCLNLSYESQNEASYSRLMSKAQKIHKKLGGSGCVDDYVKKPKNMHWKTYNRLIDEMERYEIQSFSMFAKKIGYWG